MEAVSDGPVPELHTDSKEEEPEEAEELIEPSMPYQSPRNGITQSS